MAISLKAMEYFTTALRMGKIAKAAAKPNITASAVSDNRDLVLHLEECDNDAAQRRSAERPL